MKSINSDQLALHLQAISDTGKIEGVVTDSQYKTRTWGYYPSWDDSVANTIVVYTRRPDGSVILRTQSWLPAEREDLAYFSKIQCSEDGKIWTERVYSLTCKNCKNPWDKLKSKVKLVSARPTAFQLEYLSPCSPKGNNF